MKLRFGGLQQLGRALMLPIAVLPIAGLLLRLGQPDLLGWAAMASAGDAVFSNLGLLFAVGVGVGLARENHGAAGLAAVVGFLVTTRAVETLLAAPPGTLTKLSIPVGLLSGIIAGHAYNRFSNINLPSYLSFFGGRRFVPIVSGLAGLALGVVLGYAWPFLERGMDATSHAILGAGSFGLFAYGLLNRILIITGLHHILNNFAWFIVGDYHGATGDLKRFFAGDPTAGAFMSGFFPVMMFGLPGACLAMYHTARPERRRVVGGPALIAGLDFIPDGGDRTGGIHVHVSCPGALRAARRRHRSRDGHHASRRRAAGLQLLSRAVRLRTELQPCAAAAAVAADRRRLLRAVLWSIPILHRALESRDAGPRTGRCTAAPPLVTATPNSRAQDFVTALGGARNLAEVEACTTRLRLVLNDNTAVDEATLKRLGALGIIRSSARGPAGRPGPHRRSSGGRNTCSAAIGHSR